MGAPMGGIEHRRSRQTGTRGTLDTWDDVDCTR
jgi:hypothetical protein